MVFSSPTIIIKSRNNWNIFIFISLNISLIFPLCLILFFDSLHFCRVLNSVSFEKFLCARKLHSARADITYMYTCKCTFFVKLFRVKFKTAPFHFPNSVWSKILFTFETCHAQLKIKFPTHSSQYQIKNFFNYLTNDQFENITTVL